MLDVNQIYMAHYTPLKERKEKILNDIHFEMKWFECEPTEKYWTDDKETWDRKVIPYSPHRELRQSEISLAHKHIEIYKDIVENQYTTSLVLEDDVILHDNFESMFNMFLTKTPDDWDFIYIGNGCNLRIHPSLLIPGQTAYKVNHPASKCTDSYCITLDAATKILETITPFTFPIDFELNYQMKLHNMNVYWWEPPLVTQGSQCGMYTSKIQG